MRIPRSGRSQGGPARCVRSRPRWRQPASARARLRAAGRSSWRAAQRQRVRAEEDDTGAEPGTGGAERDAGEAFEQRHENDAA